MLALTDVEVITGAVVALFLLLAIVALFRVVFKREERWLRLRIGFFLERDPLGDDDEPRQP
jgi:hypothetical protein